MKLRLINDLCATVILVIVVVLLAIVIVFAFDRNQREVVETVRQGVRDREEHDARMKSLLRQSEPAEDPR